MTVDWPIALAARFAVLAGSSARRSCPPAHGVRSLRAGSRPRKGVRSSLLPRSAPPAGDLRDRLERLVSGFIGEKEFVGGGGLALKPQMKVAIAAQACLLVLGRDTHVYDRLRSVLVYPSQFVVSGEWSEEHGIVTRGRRVLAGETWDVSRIVLSWEDVESRGEAGGAYNVVIDEFAHYSTTNPAARPGQWARRCASAGSAC